MAGCAGQLAFLDDEIVMGWTPSDTETGGRRSSVEAARFDPWQNRPDHPVRRLRTLGRRRALLVWLAIFAVLVATYTYHDDLAATGWRFVGWGGGSG